jgi:hypothetical protein
LGASGNIIGRVNVRRGRGEERGCGRDWRIERDGVVDRWGY